MLHTNVHEICNECKNAAFSFPVANSLAIDFAKCFLRLLKGGIPSMHVLDGESLGPM